MSNQERIKELTEKFQEELKKEGVEAYTIALSSTKTSFVSGSGKTLVLLDLITDILYRVLDNNYKAIERYAVCLIAMATELKLKNNRGKNE